MNYSIYALERMVHELQAQRMSEAKSYRLWKSARKTSNKRNKQ